MLLNYVQSKIFKKPESLRKKLLSRNVLADVDSYLRTAESIDDALLKVITERDRTVFPQEKVSLYSISFDP